MKDNNVVAFYCNNCHETVLNCEHNFEQLHEKGLCAKCLKKQNKPTFQMQEKDQHIAELEKELAKLKQNVIVPKFRIGQEVYSVFINRKYMEYSEVCNLEITAIMQCSKGIYYQGYILERGKNRSDHWFDENNTFLTEQEAQAKLKEMNGNE